MTNSPATTGQPLKPRVSAPSRATLKTVFKRLMPLLMLCYVISFIDRTNIGMVKADLAQDAGIGAAAYGLGAGLFFVTYALFEVPSNLIMHKIGARLWITRIMITWGLISAAMFFVNGTTSFLVLRLLLGAAEAGLYPGVLYFITRWFPHNERAKANGMFLMGAAIANIVGAPLAGLLLGLNGLAGIHGWQWMFVIEGIPACLLAIVVFKHLPDAPTKAKWLPAREAQDLQDYIEFQDASGAREAGNHSVKAALRDKQILLVMGIFFVIQIATYAMNFYLPSIISRYGAMSPLQVGLLTSIPFVFAAAGVWFIPRWAKSGFSTKLWIFGTTLAISAGLIIGLVSGPVLGMVGFCITLVGTQSGQPLLMANVGTRLKGAALAGGLAAINAFGLLGGFVGPSVMGYVESRTGNPNSGLWFIVVLAAVAAVACLGLKISSTTSTKGPDPAA